MYVNKKAVEGSFSESDEAMDESRFSISGFGVEKTAGGDLVVETMVETNMKVIDIHASVTDS